MVNRSQLFIETQEGRGGETWRERERRGRLVKDRVDNWIRDCNRDFCSS